MNKKFLYGMFSVAGMLLATSCSSEELIEQSTGDTATVSFNLTTEGASMTRAISDGTTAKTLYYAVYDKDGILLTDISRYKKPATGNNDEALTGLTNLPKTNGGETITLKLAKGQDYTVAFWAQATDAPYTVDIATNKKFDIAMNYGGDNNDESRDAFFASVPVTVPVNGTQVVTLKRPFAQINVGTSDADAAEDAGFKVSQMTSNVVIKNAANKLNVLTGEPTGDVVEVAYQHNARPTEDLNVTSLSNNPYTWLSMCYVLPTDGENSTTVATEFEFKADGKTIKLSDGLQNIPVQRNYRTNIIGNLLTNQVEFKVVIDKDFDGENNKYNDNDFTSIPKIVNGYYEIANAEQFIWLTSNNYQWRGTEGIKLVADIDFNGANVKPVIALHGTFDGQNHTMSNFAIGTSGSGTGLFSGDNIEAITIQNVTFKNVKAINPNNTDKNGYAGVVLGGVLKNEDPSANVTLNNVVVDNAEVKGVQSVGGLVGLVSGSTKLTINNCKVLNSDISNYSLANESGYIATLIGKYAGTVVITGNVESKNNKVVGIYYGGNSRPEDSITEIAAQYYTNAGSLTGVDNVTTDNNKIIAVPFGSTIISSAAELSTLNSNANVYLVKDINANGININTINYSNTDVNIYGNGYTISGLTKPLFNFYGGTIKVEELNVANSNISANDGISGCGAIAEQAQWCNISFKNCKVSNTGIVSNKDTRYGLVVGYVVGGGEIINCTVEDCNVNVSAGSVGGIVGHNQLQDQYLNYLKIENCTVKSCSLKTEETDGWRVGEIIGTVAGANTSITAASTSGNTLEQTGKNNPDHNLYGRIASTGSLTIDNVSVQ